jgi:6-phospho-3-hexuloisomerase
MKRPAGRSAGRKASASPSLTALGKAAVADLEGVVARLKDDAADDLIEAILRAKRICTYGAGREGLALRGFCMRLFHMGLDAHVVADMTTPPVGPGDLLIVTAGQGWLDTAETFMKLAKNAGAETAIVTAQPTGRGARKADIRLVIPAQTLANDRGAKVSVLPMGSLFEISEAIVFELIILKLRERVGETAESMRARHTNLE